MYVSIASLSLFNTDVDKADEALNKQARSKIDELVADINRVSQDAANSGLLDKEKYVIPPHLHDLQESDLPETQRGLVISEIAQFRERAAKREREKLRDVQASIPAIVGAPSGPKTREWGKPQGQTPAASSGTPKGHGKGAQGYNKPVGFVREEAANNKEDSRPSSHMQKTDEELEADRKEARRKDEEISFRDVRPSFGFDAHTLLTIHSVNDATNPEKETVFRQ